MLPYQVNVIIAGLVFKVRANHRCHTAWLQKHYSGYLTRKKADITVNLYSKVARRKPAKQRVFSEPYPMYAESPAANEFDIYERGDYIALTDTLRFLTAVKLLSRGGVLLHSCGVVIKDSAYLLSGPSESGKTTIARLIDGKKKLLSDETCAVRENGKGFLAWSTPFSGALMKRPANTCAKLKAILFLKQSKRFANRRLEPLSAAVKTAQNSFLLGKHREDDGLNSFFSTVVNIATRVPCYEFEFMPKQSIWKYIEEKLSPGA